MQCHSDATLAINTIDRKTRNLYLIVKTVIFTSIMQDKSKFNKMQSIYKIETFKTMVDTWGGRTEMRQVYFSNSILLVSMIS